MIRTSKHILKYQTNSKTVSLEKLFNDYKLCLEYYIDLILSESNWRKTYGKETIC